MKKLKRMVDENADDRDLPTRPSNDMTITAGDPRTKHQTTSSRKSLVVQWRLARWQVGK